MDVGIGGRRSLPAALGACALGAGRHIRACRIQWQTASVRLVMSLVVIPLATERPPRFAVRWRVQVVAHIRFVSLPRVFTARRMLRGRVDA